MCFTNHGGGRTQFEKSRPQVRYSVLALGVRFSSADHPCGDGKHETRQAPGPIYRGMRSRCAGSVHALHGAGGSAAAASASAAITAISAASSSSNGSPCTIRTSGAEGPTIIGFHLLVIRSPNRQMVPTWQSAPRAHNGMFPCFLGGRVWRLSLSIRRERAT